MSEEDTTEGSWEDTGDDAAVWTRKKPRPEAAPRNAPEREAPPAAPHNAPAPETPPAAPQPTAPARPAEEEEAPADWLLDPGPPGTDDAETEPDDVDPRALPDPPRRPMTVEESPGLSRFTGATGPERPRSPASAADPAATRASPPAPSAPFPRGPTMRIAIAATEFNYDITHMMVERAKAHATFLGAEVTHVVRVPGVYDLPLAVKRLFGRNDVDAVVTLGVVIEGETDHDDLVIQHAARKIVDLSLEHDKPVGLGITGPGMSRLQAEARIDRAKDAVEAVVKLQRELATL